jgi:glutaminase
MEQRERSPDPAQLQKAVDDIVADIGSSETRGKAADYIPELAGINVKQFGLAVLTIGGDMAVGGDADTAFSIQSISKVFSLTLALEYHAGDIWKRVGREPSGDPYNSITDLERHQGYPRNPFINSGALVVVDMLLDRWSGDEAPDFVRDFLVAEIGDDDFGVDEQVWNSETSSSSFTNRALANLAKSFGNLNHDVDDVISAYVRQCAIALSCRQLAKAGRYLMLEQVRDGDETALEAARRARRIAALMLTCGQYDGSGDFAFRVGLPAKSGVGGGILAIVPNTASIAVWSPGLDDNGNSLLGTRALERLSNAMDWSVFGAIEAPA